MPQSNDTEDFYKNAVRGYDGAVDWGSCDGHSPIMMVLSVFSWKDAAAQSPVDFVSPFDCEAFV